MFTLLRKIRKSIIESSPAVALAKEGGSMRRYLLYALGEIALIVIGILLALQISNWNENNKRQKLEMETLTEVRNELLITRGEIQTDFDAHLNEMEEMNKLLDHLIEKKENTDDLWLTFINSTRDHQAYPKSAAFENLKSVGLDLISNDSLRREITQIYQLSFQRIVDRGDYNPKYDMELAFEPYLEKYLDIDDSAFDEMSFAGGTGKMKLYYGRINNYDQFINDRTLLRELQMQMLERSNKIQRHYYTIKDIDDVVDMIEAELEI